MPSKQALGFIVSFISSIALTFTPVPNSLEPLRLPFACVAWLATAFFSGAWLNEHNRTRNLSLIEKRDRLDKFVRRGEFFYDKWMKYEKPKFRTRLWLSSTHTFVKRHFTIAEYDAFMNHPLGGRDEAILKMQINTHFQLRGKDNEAYSLALDTGQRIDALKKLREKIRD